MGPFSREISRCRAIPFAGGDVRAEDGFVPQLSGPSVAKLSTPCIYWSPSNRRMVGIVYCDYRSGLNVCAISQLKLKGISDF
jgi:hypothetical protein